MATGFDLYNYIATRVPFNYRFGGSCSCGSNTCDWADCSEVIKWAACRIGVTFTDGSWLQYRACRNAGRATSVDRAINTRGALLFHFSSSPLTGGRPSQSHVAVSDGNGGTVECRSSRYNPAGCSTWPNARNRNFNYAGLMPGLDYTNETSTLDGGAGGTHPLGDDFEMPTLIKFVPPQPRKPDPPPPPPPPIPTYVDDTVYLSPAVENMISSAGCGEHRDIVMVAVGNDIWVQNDWFKVKVSSAQVDLIKKRIPGLQVTAPGVTFAYAEDITDW